MQCILNCILQNVKMTLCSTALGHQMPLLGGTSYLKFWTNCVSNAFSIAFSRMSRWPYIVLLLATRCMYGGTAHLRVHLVLKYENVKMTLRSTPLGHQMPLLGGTSYLKFWTNCVSNAFSIAFSRMSRWPYIVLLLATRCMYGGTAHLRVHLVLKYENVKMTLRSTPLGHQMPLLGGQLVWGYTSSENMNSLRNLLLLHRDLIYERPTRKPSGLWHSR